MPPRFSIWMVLAGVMVGVIAGYLAGSGILGASPLNRAKRPDVREVREVFAGSLPPERRAEALRAFDEAVRKAKDR